MTRMYDYKTLENANILWRTLSALCSKVNYKGRLGAILCSLDRENNAFRFEIEDQVAMDDCIRKIRTTNPYFVIKKEEASQIHDVIESLEKVVVKAIKTQGYRITHNGKHTTVTTPKKRKHSRYR